MYQLEKAPSVLLERKYSLEEDDLESDATIPYDESDQESVQESNKIQESSCHSPTKKCWTMTIYKNMVVNDYSS